MSHHHGEAPSERPFWYDLGEEQYARPRAPNQFVAPVVSAAPRNDSSSLGAKALVLSMCTLLGAGLMWWWTGYSATQNQRDLLGEMPVVVSPVPELALPALVCALGGVAAVVLGLRAVAGDRGRVCGGLAAPLGMLAMLVSGLVLI